MVTDQTAISQSIAQVAVEAVKGAIQAMAVAVGISRSGMRIEPRSMGPKLDRPTLKQPVFDWGSLDKYMELRTSG